MGRTVDHDLRDRLVGQQRIERAEASDLPDQLPDQARTLLPGDGEPTLDDDPLDDHLDLASELRRIGDIEERVEGDHHLVLEAQSDLAQQLLALRDLNRVQRDRRRKRRRGRSGFLGLLDVGSLLRPLDAAAQRHDVGFCGACDMVPPFAVLASAVAWAGSLGS